MAIGVFGLQVAYKLKRTELLSIDDTHGWFGGGRPSPLSTSTVDRIDFSNDTGTASVRGPLSSARGYFSATGNSNYGWFGGGNTPTPSILSTVDRIDFSNDSPTASVRGSLSSARFGAPTTGNSNYGWFGGGIIPGLVVISLVDRIDFSNDSPTASPRGLLSAARGYSGGAGNSNYGWFGGGFGAAAVSIVDRIDFSNDSATTSLRSPLSLARYFLAATGNSNYGWFGGGKVSVPAAVSTVDRIDFSNDLSTASVRGPLSAVKGYLAATGNSNYGWFGGGFLSPSVPVTYYSVVDRIDFSNDLSSASPRGLLTVGRQYPAATSGQAKGPAIKLQKAGNYGWFGGGANPAGVSTVDRVDFSNDLLAASPRGLLSLAREGLSATGNSNYGWFGGGFSSTTPSFLSYRTAVDRINFSNDSVTTLPRGRLNQQKSTTAATGNSNYGWFGGGYYTPASTYYASVDRIDFSNDSAAASPRGVLSLARSYLAATGNSNYGWFGGGFTGATTLSTVDRIDFSNDSVTAQSRGSLSAINRSLSATGNSNYGWFGGGLNPALSPPYRSTVDRIDFSNDSVAASPRGVLSLARSNLAATGNSNYGWFGGGQVPAPFPIFFSDSSIVDRIDFSNDSATASVRSPLSLSKNSLAATSNATR